MHIKKYDSAEDIGGSMLELRCALGELIQEMDRQARHWKNKQEGMIAYWTGQQKANMDHLSGQQQELIDQCKDLSDSLNLETKKESWAGRIWELVLVLCIAVPLTALCIVLANSSDPTNQQRPVTEKKLVIPKQTKELLRLVPINPEE